MKRIGPTVEVKRSCFDCTYCRSESYHVQGDSGHDVTCQYPGLAGGPNDRRRYIGDTTWATPSWCPVLAREGRAAPSPSEKEPAR